MDDDGYRDWEGEYHEARRKAANAETDHERIGWIIVAIAALHSLMAELEDELDAEVAKVTA
jgi:hypothetical protein